jgi:hypothetical protein
VLYASIVFNEIETGRQQRVTVGHMWRGEKVLRIAGEDPVCILQGHGIETIPAGMVVHAEPDGRPVPPRTVKAAVPEPVAQLVHRGSVKSMVYHHGHKRHELVVGQLVEGRFRLTEIFDGDPVHISLLDARGAITSRELCGLGSVAEFRYAA